GMGHRDMRGAELKVERANLVEITDGAVCHHPHAAERAVDVRLHLAPLRALPAGVVEVVDHDHPRRGDGQDEIPPPEEARAVGLAGGAAGGGRRGGWSM